MKTLSMIACVAFVLGGCQSAREHDGNGNGGGAPIRTYVFTYATTIPAQPGAATLDVWVPLPMSDPGVQSVRDLQVTASKGVVLETTEPKYGNRMAYVRVVGANEPVTISWTATVTRHEDNGQGSLPNSGWYLRANDLIPVDGPARALAQALKVDDLSIAVADRAKVIYDDVLDHMKYDKKHEGWGRGSFEHATTVCMGNCTDFHARFIGTARAGKIPTRFTMGIPMKPGAGTYNSYHCWAHWYDDGRWHPVDISEADKIVGIDLEGAQRFFGQLGYDRLALTFGRDITLNPPQKGAALTYFVFPYAEADGKTVELGKTDWTFTWTDA